MSPSPVFCSARLQRSDFQNQFFVETLDCGDTFGEHDAE